MKTIATALALVMLPVTVQAQDALPERSLAVSAMSEVEVQPDRARLLVAVETVAETAAAAATENARKMDAVLAAVRGLGIAPDRIRTVGYHLQPQYARDRPQQPGEAPRIVGYRASNTVQVTMDEIPAVARVIDTALNAGADRVAGLYFELRDPEAARHRALEAAVAKARAEAEVLATAAGQRLGPLLTLTTEPAPRIPRIMAAADAVRMEAAPPTPIEPGTMTVTATVSAVYRLEP